MVDKVGFMVPVDRRDAATFLPVISYLVSYPDPP